MFTISDLIQVQEVVESKLSQEEIKRVSDSIMKKANGDKRLYYGILREVAKDQSISEAARLTAIYIIFLYQEV
jgi:hypothetical protein